MISIDTVSAGMLLFAALLAAGILAAQQKSRRTARGWLGYSLRLACFGLLALFVLLSGLLLGTVAYTLQIQTAPARSTVHAPADLPFTLERVTFRAEDGIALAGWYVPAQNGRTIILLHGYGSTRASMLWHASALVRAGYGVLLYDARASGESGGTRRSYGWEDAPDVRAALDFLAERAPERDLCVGAAGCSIGAQVALQGAVRYPQIHAVWADGPSNIRAADSLPPRNALGRLLLASNYLLDAFYEHKLGQPGPPPLIEQIGQISPRPLMLVSGGKTQGMLGSETERVQHFAEHAGPHAQVWVIDDATHCDGPNRQPAQYEERLVAFFDSALDKACAAVR